MKLAKALIALVALALLAPAALHRSPTAQDRDRVHQAPSLARAEAGAPVYPLGTDGLGRDVLARTLNAARFSLATAFVAATTTLALGGVLGVVSGLLGGLCDRAIMRGAELFMSFPALYLLLALRNLFGDALSPLTAGLLIALVLVAVGWSPVARLVRGQVLAVREADFVLAARAAGASRASIVRDHVLPVLKPFLLLQLGLLVPSCLLGEVTLSYLGLGLPEPHASLGNMLAAVSTSGLSRYWWTWAAPATMLTAASLGANVALEGLRERYSPSASPSLWA